MKYAPIVLFAFNRLEAVKSCVASLLANPEASESDLAVFVDGARVGREGEVQNVEAVCSYVRGITGFRSAEVHASSVNMGLGPSVIAGVSDVINRFGRAIVVEDDLVAAQNFLSFMNQGLDRFETVPEVFSVCGYSNRVHVPDGYGFDAYFCPRSSSWGWATWVDRWNSCDWMLDEWATVKKNACAFNRWGGSDCFSMLNGWKQGRNKSWAIRFCYNQFTRNALSVFPLVSKIENNGFDGDGTNCGKWSRFKSDFDNTGITEFVFPEIISVDPGLRRQSLHYHSLPLRAYSRLMNYLYK